MTVAETLEPLDLEAHENLRIVAFAYACEPGKGSEPGAGWAWVRMLACLGSVHVVTRANNRESIESALMDIDERERMHFAYVDLPRWARVWKRGQRGVRVYYLLWQIAAVRHARREHRSHPFDLAWHVTLANAWLGSLAPLVGTRFFYGPVGGGLRVPWRLGRALGLKGTTYELIREFTRAIGRYLNPYARLAWRRAEVILTQNSETREWLPRKHQAKAIVCQHAVIGECQPPSGRESVRTALFAGRLLPWKGVALAIRAISLTDDWRLLISGTGPDEARLRRLVDKLSLDERVTFLNWQPREHLQRLMRTEATLLLLPSLHDDSPWVVAEALANGLGVVCLDRGGPPLLMGSAGIPCDSRGGWDEVTAALAEALRTFVTPTPDQLQRAVVALSVEQRVAILRDLVSGVKAPSRLATGGR